MTLPPLPRRWARVLSGLVLVAWVGQMGLLLRHAAREASGGNLAADLAQYGSTAAWKGIYSRGAKIGFTVSQVAPRQDGYELQEDGRLQMTMLGVSTAAVVRTSARVDKAFELRSFSFTLDPGTGPITIAGRVEGTRLDYTVTTPSGSRSESRDLPEPPALALNLSRRLAASGLREGARHTFPVFDPATLRNAPMTLTVGRREVVRAAGRPVPAFRVDMNLSGLSTTAWVTDVGEVVREESPTGLVVVKETRDRATALAVPGDVQQDLLETAAVVPRPPRRIEDPRSVELLRVRLSGAELPAGPDLEGAGQTVRGDVFEVRDARALSPGPADPEARRHLAPEPLVESDAPEIVAEAGRALAGVTGPRERAERLVRHVNALLEKKPTVSLPSALEVLRTRVGDCNEHAALYVALARAAGLPARSAVGLVYLQGAFYYHAWAEVHVAEEDGRSLWLPVDPTLNQFPADATHLRLARGGLDRQAVVLPLLGRLQMRVLDLRLRPGATPVLVGQAPQDIRPLDLPLPRRGGSGAGCWSSPPR